MLNESLEKLGSTETSGYSVFGGSGLESIKLPSSLKVLTNYLFHDCKNLRSIELPACLERIGEECFSESGLEEFRAPPELTIIGNRAFKDCENLKYVMLNKGL